MSVAVVNGQPRDPSLTPNKENHNPATSANNTPTNANAAAPQQAQRADPVRRCEIYRYTSTKPLFAAAWSHKKDSKFRLAVGTLAERDQGNRVSIIQLDEDRQELVEKGNFNHEFPASAISFIPDPNNVYPDLIATCSDVLRLWRIGADNTVAPEVVLSSNKSHQYTSPLTNFDWNEQNPALVGTSSIDTTCTIYNVEVGVAIAQVSPVKFSVTTQLIAHDKPVHDIAFSRIGSESDHFATVGADGSARMFDLRHLEHSTIVYEDPAKTPLMRLAWNKQESYHLATYAQDSTEVIIVDIRMPCSPLARLKNHSGAVNGLAWAPHSGTHICTASDDSQALIWDLSSIPRPIDDPILAYTAGGEVNQVHWGAVHQNWICICFNKNMEILRV